MKDLTTYHLERDEYYAHVVRQADGEKWDWWVKKIAGDKENLREGTVATGEEGKAEALKALGELLGRKLEAVKWELHN